MMHYTLVLEGGGRREEGGGLVLWAILWRVGLGVEVMLGWRE